MQTLPCPTAYLEGCFIDNKADFAHIDTSEKRRELGESYARGILNFLGLAYLPPASEAGKVLQYVNALSTAETENVLQSVKSTKTVYRVVAGSYSTRENAEKHALELKNQGVETFVAAYEWSNV
jgi:hypothetical protein